MPAGKLPDISFEYFPPRTPEVRERLARARQTLHQYDPEYVSVTFGAGGSTIAGTRETVLEIQRQDEVSAAPHVSCLGCDREQLIELLQTYEQQGVKRIVALRGDAPSGSGGGSFEHAIDLVRLIRERFGGRFHIEVGCYPEFHPEASSAKSDMRHFVRKVDAGADGAITQYFFNADSYFQFVERAGAMGVDVPITPGIMPITNYKQLARFSDACGAEIPRWLRWRLQSYGKDMDSLRDFGVDFVTRMCERLIEGGAPALHFYTLNRETATKAILDRLGYRSAPALRNAS